MTLLKLKWNERIVKRCEMALDFHDLRLTTKERMNVLANHQTTHKDELADHQINMPVQTNELAKELSLSHSEKKQK
ncbi:hypothetical protein IGI04_030201 [Brassica rapa subsp. trilocularis]|uniref:Uncharacterized protein n=1 Tax=Brassica rapa subsp. trilocularis TaxID=1813537 RepID=A0ABQ7LSR8_BRACM|nr:hypothetical protein IGI04_030201 [Brassica rapa subsp. trilocularis]